MIVAAKFDERLKKIDPVTDTRDIENDFLRSENFLDILENRSISLKPFHTIKN